MTGLVSVAWMRWIIHFKEILYRRVILVYISTLHFSHTVVKQMIFVCVPKEERGKVLFSWFFFFFFGIDFFSFS